MTFIHVYCAPFDSNEPDLQILATNSQVAQEQHAAKKVQSVWRGLVARRRVEHMRRTLLAADAAAETSDPRVHGYGLRRPDTDEEVCSWICALSYLAS